jgi:hypothetical protein
MTMNSCKSNSWKLRGIIALGIVAIAFPLTIPEGYSQTSGGTWQSVTQAPTNGLANPLLLTDGTVIIHQTLTTTWYKFTPDNTGNYVNGTWSQIASMPSGYGPEFFASAVLPDGRVIVEGGEYNLVAGSETVAVWTSLGAIYDPIGDAWTAVSPPSGAGWLNTDGTGMCNGGIGDAPSIVLPNGTFLIGAACANPSVDALFDATTLSWSGTGAPQSYQHEQGYTLLQNGKVLTIDTHNPHGARAYDPATGTWASIAQPPVQIGDMCGTDEIGPALTRPDGTIVAFGGYTGCAANPTAIYTPSTDSWIQGPNLPAICGANGTTFCNSADVPAALLPNGNILFAADSGDDVAPSHFFEFTSNNAINQVADTASASNTRANAYNFLVLPNGQILATDFTNTVEIYTPTGGPNASWAPIVTSIASCVSPGGIYLVV